MSTFTVVEEQGVAVVSIDQPGSPVNVLTAAAKSEFETILEQFREDKAVRAVVLISGKPDNFIAGADIEQFVALPNQAAAEALSRDGQATMDRVAAFPKPIICLRSRCASVTRPMTTTLANASQISHGAQSRAPSGSSGSAICTRP